MDRNVLLESLLRHFFSSAKTLGSGEGWALLGLSIGLDRVVIQLYRIIMFPEFWLQLSHLIIRGVFIHLNQ